MNLNVALGFSENLDTLIAIKEAGNHALTQLNGQKADVVIVFSSIHYNPNTFLPVLKEIFPDSTIIGCSVAGLITSHGSFARGISILCIHSIETIFDVSGIKNVTQNQTRQSGMNLSKKCLEKFSEANRQLFCTFTESHQSNASLFLNGIHDAVGTALPIIGAGSTDDFHFRSSFQFHNTNVYTKGAVGFMLGGQVQFGIGAKHGWRPLGKPRIIDESTDNIIHSISGKKAFSLYEEYFADEVNRFYSSQFNDMSLLYPLGIAIEGNDEYLLRNAIDILKDGSIVCHGDVPRGAEVHIMIGNKESCLDSAKKAAQEAFTAMAGSKTQIVLVFDSMARFKLLGRSAFDEIKKIKNLFGQHTPIFGMYCYGQFAPFQDIGATKKSFVQNENIVVIALG